MFMAEVYAQNQQEMQMIQPVNTVQQPIPLPAMQQPYVQQEQYPPYQPPYQERPLDERYTEDAVNFLGAIQNPYQAIVAGVAMICITLIWIFRKYGKDILAQLKQISDSRALNGDFDELVEDIKEIKEETLKNTQQNQIDHSRWQSYCQNPRNAKKEECRIPT